MIIRKVVIVMSELTVFERFGVQYEEMDGNVYPILEMATETTKIDVGKYGKMWIEHIKVVYPERYRCLLRFGELSERASQVNETAYELLEDIEIRWLRKHKPENPNSFVEQFRLRNQAREMAEEAVLVDVVRQFH